MENQIAVRVAYMVMSCGYLMNNKLKKRKKRWWTLTLSKSRTR
jgi:hypothetical protein